MRFKAIVMMTEQRGEKFYAETRFGRGALIASKGWRPLAHAKAGYRLASCEQL